MAIFQTNNLYGTGVRGARAAAARAGGARAIQSPAMMRATHVGRRNFGIAILRLCWNEWQYFKQTTYTVPGCGAQRRGRWEGRKGAKRVPTRFKSTAGGMVSSWASPRSARPTRYRDDGIIAPSETRRVLAAGLFGGAQCAGGGDEVWGVQDVGRQSARYLVMRVPFRSEKFSATPSTKLKFPIC